MVGDLAAIVGAEHVQAPVPRDWLEDATATQGLTGQAEALVLPANAEEVARVLAWCYARGVPIVPRGGGTGLAGGAVPSAGSVVLALARLDRVRGFEPERWRAHVEAGVRTARLARLAREHGLLFGPHTGAAEQSQIGGNIATNAGGPQAFKYGVTGDWVLGLEAAVAPGELIELGGPLRKDVAGYDLKRLLIGSEGTLGVITAAWLRLVPAPETSLAVCAFYPGTPAGCQAVEEVLATGVVPTALEYLDGGTLSAAGPALPGGVPGGTQFMVLAEADGTLAESRRIRGELLEALAPDALELRTLENAGQMRALARWRDGLTLAVTAQEGGKLSEDIVVPLERLREAIEGTVAIGERHGLRACSWGHAGDANLHSTFLLRPGDRDQHNRARAAAQELFAMALAMGGSVSGEHGLGSAKRGQLARQWDARALALHAQIKRAFDPRGLLNPGKKV